MSRFIQPWRREFRDRRRSAGIAAVEFVIAAPILIVVLLAVAELGRAFIQYERLSYAVRDSARFVSENAIEGTTGVVYLSDAVIGQAKNLVLYGTVTAGSTPLLPGLSASHVTVLDAGGNNIEVIATYPYQPMIGGALPLFGRDSLGTRFPLQISVTMRAIS